MSFSPEAFVDWIMQMGHDPIAIGVFLALATLLSEDGALIAGSLLVGGAVLSATLVITALVAGIVLGDIGLYGIGALARESRFVRKRLSPRRMRRLKRWLDGREAVVLFLSRFLPGTRLPTYLGFGYLKLSLIRFTCVMTIAGITWVSAMVLFVSETQKLLSSVDSTLGIAGGLAIAFLFVIVIPRLVRRTTDAPDLSLEVTDERRDDGK